MNISRLFNEIIDRNGNIFTNPHMKIFDNSPITSRPILLPSIDMSKKQFVFPKVSISGESHI